MSKIWFTSDTHFGHQRTLELSKRPFKTTEDMDNIMIANWNSVVEENDVVYHLGDFGDYEMRKFLNGKIVLLVGNYENEDFKKNDNLIYDIYEKYGFDSVLHAPAVPQEFNDRNYYLVHEPSHYRGVDFKLFGHIHKLQMVKSNGLNVGVDCHNFTPIDLETVEFYRNAIENHYDEEVFKF